MYDSDIGFSVFCDVGVVDLVVFEPLEVWVKVTKHDLAREHRCVAHGNCLVLGSLNDRFVRQTL